MQSSRRASDLRIISFRIDVGTLYQIDKEGLRRGMNRSEIIRNAIRRYLDAEIYKQ
ncbi:MAG: ribbon-helix-helix protein, CopG family [Caldisphaeraceae archaeon]|nr:ribbon-helix-helix protein, CopG family [Caldisphaeraceae archaeon]MEB2793730.1 ribbon-helix-helix protein, CopG family [Caldisphaeraceae archaeon]MEB3691981.1 ribbon-helix-helix protein, CopG family [Caldisphaeraceae archaeon]MEB3798619.1 ribbon-helix-helix protein, CopG family [Caldisphaeraceae archaeon]